MPSGFPPEAALAAVEAAARRPGPEHVDRTDRPFVTLDPAGSTDLDQAFALERAGDDIVLHYAIADVGFFVRSRRPSRPRGVAARRHRVHARRAGPAVPGGTVGGRGEPAARRAAPGGRVHRPCRPRRRRRASTVSSGRSCTAGPSSPTRRSRPADLPPELADLAGRMRQRGGASQRARGSSSPSRSSTRVDGRWTLRFEPRRESEDLNAGLSLATNLAVADALLAAGTGHLPRDGRAGRRGCPPAAPHGVGVRPRLAVRPVARRLPALAARPTTLGRRRS